MCAGRRFPQAVVVFLLLTSVAGSWGSGVAAAGPMTGGATAVSLGSSGPAAASFGSGGPAPVPPGTGGAAVVPLGFEPGPTGEGFRARAGAYEVWVDESGIRFRSRPARGSEVVELSLRLLGGDGSPAPVPASAPSGISHYLRGRDPSGWVTGVPRYEAVRWEDVYTGIDWVLRDEGGGAAYDFVVAAGADPRRIRLLFDGADHLSLDADGNLVVAVGRARFVHSAPVIYQATGAARRAVDGAFRLDPGGTEVGFLVGEYDPRLELVIDPAIGFSSYLGGISSEDLPRIALGADGGVYVAGTTSSTDFPVGVHGRDDIPATSPGGDVDAFVARLDPGGAQVDFATYLGGAGMDRATGVAVSEDGSVWVVGQTSSTDFPAAAGSLRGPADGFVARISPDGTEVEFAALVGGGSVESATGIALDDRGQVVIVGATGSEDFPLVNAHQDRLGGEGDAFVVKLDPAAGRTAFATYLGGAQGDDAGFAVAIDAGGNAWVTGSSSAADFPSVRPLQEEAGTGDNAFVAKIDDAGNVVFSTTLGGSGTDVGLAIDVDAAGAAYVTGQTDSTDFPTRAPFQQLPGGGGDAFVTKIAPDGASVVYSTFLGGEGVDVGGGIAVDGSGNAHVTGMTASADFPVADSLQPYFGGGADVFVTRIDDRGTGITYSTFSGGGGAEAGVGIAVDGAGNAYVSGHTSSADFPTYNAAQPELSGPQDAFVTKYCLSLVFPDERQLGSATSADSFAVTTPAGCVWIAFSQSPWIALTSPNVVAGAGEVRFQVEPNATGVPRSGTLNVAGREVVVIQEAATACEYEITPTSDNFFMVGGVGRINVFTTDDCAWVAVSNADWIQLTNDRGTGDSVVSYSVESNRTGRQRSGTITVAGHTFVVFDWLR